jgi:hypothetical protein
VGFLRRERRVGRTHPRENEIRRKKLANFEGNTSENLLLLMENMIKIYNFKKEVFSMKIS